MTYRIVKKVSQGGFSEIFEVRDSASVLPEALILKRLSPEMSTRPDVRAAFTREGEILSGLKHPNVVHFRRCYYDERGRICLLMEKIEGDNLAIWARRHRDDSWQVMEAFRLILEAVDSLHHRAHPLLHLDLKPENILVSSTTAGPQPVLIDFGIARSAGGQGLKAYTPPYGAPEQQKGRKLGCFTDVYALGQILHELLETLEEGEDQHSRKRLQLVADKARSSSRRKRYPDAGSMLAPFREARATHTHLPPEPGRRWAVPAAAALGVLGIPALYLAFEGSSPPDLVVPPPPPPPVSECEPEQWPSRNPDLVDHLLDRCIEDALASDSLDYMENRYKTLRVFLAATPQSTPLQEEWVRKVDLFEHRIDERDRQ